MPPDRIKQPVVLDGAADVVANTLRRTVRRMRLRDGLVLVAAVLAVEAVGILLGWRVIGLLGGAIAASLIWRRGRARRNPAQAAACIERALPECRNVVITAEEMQRGLHQRPEWVWTRVMREAAERVRNVEPGQIVPLARAVVSLGAAVVVFVAVLMGGGPVATTAMRATLESLSNSGKVAAAMPLHVRVTISPPVYIAQPSRDYADPERITAIEGSTVRINATGGDRRWGIRFGDQALAVQDAGDASTAVMTVAATGYIAIDHREQLGGESAERPIPVTVSPDRAPTVRVTTPGRDVVVANVSQPVKVEASASDDFGLRSLEVLYTRVSGTGEQFNFEEGTLPITILRDSPLSWKASGEISLASLKLRPGDALVYRAVARDGRPADRGLATSDTFFIEVAGPGQIALEGFEMPPDQERYALSQQMIVLKIRRLRARERTLSPYDPRGIRSGDCRRTAGGSREFHLSDGWGRRRSGDGRGSREGESGRAG